MQGRAPFRWKVTLQRADGQVVEQEYRAFWSPAKVEPLTVAQAAAAELTVAHGFDANHAPRMQHVGLTAVPA